MLEKPELHIPKTKTETPDQSIKEGTQNEPRPKTLRFLEENIGNFWFGTFLKTQNTNFKEKIDKLNFTEKKLCSSKDVVTKIER